MPRNLQLLLLLAQIILVHPSSFAQEHKGPNGTKPSLFHTTVPDQPYNIILSRPTNHSIVVSVFSMRDFDGYLQYKKQNSGVYSKTKAIRFTSGHTENIQLNDLEKNCSYQYQLITTAKEKENILSSSVRTFHTARANNSVFRFAIQADSHLDENCDTLYYRTTSENILTESPDFLIDLGDTWMTDKYREDYKQSLQQYKAQRYFFGTLCHSVPLMLTLGNHDGEPGKPAKKTGDENMTQWATETRRFYYSNPYPDGFYEGNREKDATGNYLQNYYSWEWGNALFVVLDPFRYTLNNKNPWSRTLGKEQYQWLKQTLQNSKADFKFIFIHNLVGGQDNKGIARGGAEASLFFEWGGKNADSTEGFGQQRSGWEMPIHELLKQNKVTAVFHGHDHFYAKQERDGIIYQLLPQPGYTRYSYPNQAAEYGYVNGTIMNAPGFIEVEVKEKECTVQYLQTHTGNQNKKLLDSYSIKKP